MRSALARHDALAAALISQHDGTLVKSRGEGDSLFAVFARATDAVAAACALQRTLLDEPWPEPVMLRARMALHTGEADLRDGDYYGSAVNRCARLRGIAHGGQILVSQATGDLVRGVLPEGVTLRASGWHRLRDLQQPENVFQLLHPALPADFPALRSLEAFAHNLPVALTSFIGREQEMAEVKRLLKATRLLTITGAGGSGKTRLALQVAADLLEEYPDGVWLAELAALSDPALVPQALARVLHVREDPNRPLTETLADFLRPRSLLMLLDNCEHLVDACAHLAEALLRTCPDLKILVTSRTALAVGGELTWRVPSLLMPDPGRLPPVDSLPHFPAVRLFVERASLSRPNFAVTDRNAPSVAQLCHRLDGMPLALELAAARVRVLSVEQIVQRLDDRFQLLTGGSRTALPRHQTLRAMVDWSYDLLDEAERTLLRRLSVFAGGWTLAAAEAACAGDGIEDGQVLDLLARLMDESLVESIVVAEEAGVGEAGGGEETRYRLLETVRLYARDRLLEAGEAEAVRGRHRDWFLALAERAERELQGPEQAAWLDRLEAEHDNLRAALAWSVESETRLRLAGALWRFWYVRGYLSEGRGWMEGALSQGRGVPEAVRAKALNGAGNLASLQGDHAAARRFHEESLALRQKQGDKRGMAGSFNNLGMVARNQGDHATARSFWEKSLALHREMHDAAGVAKELSNLGCIYIDLGDYAAARSLLEDSLTIQRELGNKWYIAAALYNLGYVAYKQGDYATARVLFNEDLVVRQELGERSGIAAPLHCLGLVAMHQSYYERAARLLGAAEAARETIGVPLSPTDRTDHAYDIAAIRAGLSEEAFAAAWAQGKAMPLEQVIAYALEK